MKAFRNLTASALLAAAPAAFALDMGLAAVPAVTDVVEFVKFNSLSTMDVIKATGTVSFVITMKAKKACPRGFYLSGDVLSVDGISSKDWVVSKSGVTAGSLFEVEVIAVPYRPKGKLQATKVTCA